MWVLGYLYVRSVGLNCVVGLTSSVLTGSRGPCFICIAFRPKGEPETRSMCRLPVLAVFVLDHGFRRGRRAVGLRRRARYQTTPAVTAAAPIATAVSTEPLGAENSGSRRLSCTGRSKTSTGHSRACASLRSARSGLTAEGWPTASSSGRSVEESL